MRELRGALRRRPATGSINMRQTGGNKRPLGATMRRLLAAMLFLVTTGRALAATGSGSRWPAGQSTLSKGLVVPKSSALISGLNHQFSSKTRTPTAAAPSTSLLQTAASPGEPAIVPTAPIASPPPPAAPFKSQGAGQLAGQLHSQSQSHSQPQQASRPQPEVEPEVGASPTGGGLLKQRLAPSLAWLRLRNVAPGQGRPAGRPGPAGQPGGLLEERRQQELLAANPTALAGGLAANSSMSAALRGELPSNGRGPSGVSVAPPASGQEPQGAQWHQAQQQSYRGFSLIELEIRGDSERRFVQELYGNLSAALDEQAAAAARAPPLPLPYAEVDFWTAPKWAPNDEVDIMVSPKARALLLGQLSRARIKHRVKVDDMQARLEQTGGGAQGGVAGPGPQSQLSGRHGAAISAQPTTASGAGAASAASAVGAQPEQVRGRSQPLNESEFFENYQRLAEINQFLESMVEKNRDVARVKVIGRSSQGRHLRVLRLGYETLDSFPESRLEERQAAPSQTGNSSSLAVERHNNATFILAAFFKRLEQVKRVGSIWLDGGTHAREWISPATALYIAHRLADNHNKCRKFFDQLKASVERAEVDAALDSAAREARKLTGAGRALNSAPAPATVDAELLSGINDINSSLLGKPASLGRPQTELERRLELLAKSPQEVATEFNCDLGHERLLRRYMFLIEPVLNPDGYEFSHSSNRLWRKTRSTSTHPIYRHFCLGADPNRNYDTRHGSTGSSSHPCSQTYAGTTPFTEPETRHQSNYVYANREHIKMYISLHSYSQMILLPYSHSRQLTPDHKDLEAVGMAAVKAIERTHGTVYKMGASASILYTASGTASDWAYEKAGIKYSYTIELRDTGSYGFLLPKQQIVPTGEETFNGFLAMIEQMERNEQSLVSKSSPSSSSSQAAGPALTSEHLHSTNAAAATGSAAATLQSSVFDLNKVTPELRDQLAAAKLGTQFRPSLENALDGCQGCAELDRPPSGPRDRLRPPEAAYPEEFHDESSSYWPPGGQIGQSQQVRGSNSNSNQLRSSAHRWLDHANRNPGTQEEQAAGEEINNELANEPDSGYAFEGEGELMEPTRENIIEAAKMANDKMKSGVISGRKDHSQRISLAMALTGSGRSAINSPQLTGRGSEARGMSAAPVPQRRESSEHLKQTP